MNAMEPRDHQTRCMVPLLKLHILCNYLPQKLQTVDDQNTVVYGSVNLKTCVVHVCHVPHPKVQQQMLAGVLVILCMTISVGVEL